MIGMLWHEHKLALGALVVLAAVALTSVVEVDETEQAVVLRNGAADRVINKFKPNQDFGQTGAGLSLRIPIVETLVRVDKRIQPIEMDRQLVISSDQQRLEVDAFALYRVIDPVRMVQTAGTVDRLREQLQPILNSRLRRGLAVHTFQTLLTADRGAVMAQIRDQFDKEARQYGVQVIDVRIKRADLPEGTALERAFANMEAAREQEATAIRADGQKQAQIIEADAEARAAQIYAASFNKDPSFYDFYRAMKSYEATMANPQMKSGTTIVLTPDNDYLRQFRGGGKAK
ncbi:MAG: protease modulator HflC [Sphingomonadales bacterium]|nr:protease modulator HflC [Sphingomonadales bacterium]MDE2168836.1 protease modulator HflC [Sphingomonadales bacterium]